MSLAFDDATHEMRGDAMLMAIRIEAVKRVGISLDVMNLIDVRKECFCCQTTPPDGYKRCCAISVHDTNPASIGCLRFVRESDINEAGFCTDCIKGRDADVLTCSGTGCARKLHADCAKLSSDDRIYCTTCLGALTTQSENAISNVPHEKLRPRRATAAPPAANKRSCPSRDVVEEDPVWKRRGFPMAIYHRKDETLANYCPCLTDDLRDGMKRCATVIRNADGDVSMLGCFEQKAEHEFDRKMMTKLIKRFSKDKTEFLCDFEGDNPPYMICNECLDDPMSYEGIVCDNYSQKKGGCKRWQLHPRCTANKKGVCALIGIDMNDAVAMEAVEAYCRDCLPLFKGTSFHPRPRGRPPKGKDWDVINGKWVACCADGNCSKRDANAVQSEIVTEENSAAGVDAMSADKPFAPHDDNGGLLEKLCTVCGCNIHDDEMTKCSCGEGFAHTACANTLDECMMCAS